MYLIYYFYLKNGTHDFLVTQLRSRAVSVLAILISDIPFSRHTIVKGLLKLGDRIGAYSVGSTNQPGTVIPQRVMSSFRKLKASCAVGVYILAKFSVLGRKNSTFYSMFSN